MRKSLTIVALLATLAAVPAFAGDAEVKSAQTTITNQIEAFKAGDIAKAYSYAAPNIQRIFPTVESFMKMVTGAYDPVYHPQSYTFGKVQETGPNSLIQEVLIVGADGKSYQAVYTLARQDDGTFRITGVSMRASNALSA